VGGSPARYTQRYNTEYKPAPGVSTLIPSLLSPTGPSAPSRFVCDLPPITYCDRSVWHPGSHPFQKRQSDVQFSAAPLDGGTSCEEPFQIWLRSPHFLLSKSSVTLAEASKRCKAVVAKPTAALLTLGTASYTLCSRYFRAACGSFTMDSAEYAEKRNW
jgi:hypothetical protein